MKESALDRAAVAAGISLIYTNAKGEPEVISEHTKAALLAVMDDARQEKGAPLPPVQVFSGGAARQLNPQGCGLYQWRLRSKTHAC